jgi:hypothetical protein
VDRLVRGSSSLLGRIGKSPAQRGFLLPGTDLSFRPMMDVLLSRDKYVQSVRPFRRRDNTVDALVSVRFHRGAWEVRWRDAAAEHDGDATPVEDRVSDRPADCLAEDPGCDSGPMPRQRPWRLNGTAMSLSVSYPASPARSNRRRTSEVFTPSAPSSTAAGSGGWSARIWASTSGPVTWSFR